MNTINKITTWGDSHHFAWLDIFRIALGAFLIFKGVEFGRDPHEIKALIGTDNSSLFAFFFVQIIPMIHIAGGVMIALGIMTRWAVIFQIPVLLGAVILSVINARPMEMYSELAISGSVLLVLIAFLIYGSGPFSVDAFFKKNEDVAGM
jgi:putative oxidoreductase